MHRIRCSSRYGCCVWVVRSASQLPSSPCHPKGLSSHHYRTSRISNRRFPHWRQWILELGWWCKWLPTSTRDWTLRTMPYNRRTSCITMGIKRVPRSRFIQLCNNRLCRVLWKSRYALSQYRHWSYLSNSCLGYSLALHKSRVNRHSKAYHFPLGSYLQT